MQRRHLDPGGHRPPVEWEQQHANGQPSLAELALAAAELDGDPLANEPALLRRAADEVVKVKADATSDDVLVWAAALRSVHASR